MNSTPINPIRPVSGAIRKELAETVAKAPGKPAPQAGPEPTLVSTALNAGLTPPVDAERVALIRSAIAHGTYPVLPAKIADAMIAAGLLLRTPK